MGLPVVVGNHNHSCRYGKSAEEQEQIGAVEQGQSTVVVRQERSIGVAEQFEQVQIAWKQKLAHTEVRRFEHTDQKPEHTVVQKLTHTGFQKPEQTGAQPERTGVQKPERTGVLLEHIVVARGGDVVAAAGFQCSACLQQARCLSSQKRTTTKLKSTKSKSWGPEKTLVTHPQQGSEQRIGDPAEHGSHCLEAE